MKKKIQARIHHLRSQPEHVRFRAASYITAIAGVAIVILWVTVLLPLQLYLQRDKSGGEAEQQASQAVQETMPLQRSQSQVGGVQDELFHPSSLRNEPNALPEQDGELGPFEEDEDLKRLPTSEETLPVTVTEEDDE